MNPSAYPTPPGPASTAQGAPPTPPTTVPVPPDSVSIGPATTSTAQVAASIGPAAATTPQAAASTGLSETSLSQANTSTAPDSGPPVTPCPRGLLQRLTSGKALSTTLWQIALCSALAAMLVSSAALLVWDIHTTHRHFLKSTGEHTNMIAANISAAVSFGDDAEASATLESLRAISGVEAARVWDQSGRVLATFRREGGPVPVEVPEAPPFASGDRDRLLGQVESVRSVVAGGNIVGTIYVRDNLSLARGRVRDSFLSLAFAVPLAALVSLAFALRLNRVIVAPIERLTAVTDEVSRRNSYAVRVKPCGARELRSLAAGFNHMLSRVQERDAELESARANLTAQVEQRTAHLEESLLQMRQTNDALQASRAELARQKALLDSVVSVIPYRLYWRDRERRLVWCNSSFAADLGCHDSTAMSGAAAGPFRPFLRQLAEGDEGVLESGKPVLHEMRVHAPEGGGKQFFDISRVPMTDPGGAVCGIVGIYTDITDQVEAQAERERLLAELGVASRQAGMAEVATGVLHNVGNILNSINVSATAVARGLRESKVPSVSKVAGLLEDHRGDLPGFLLADARGKMLPDYLCKLGGILNSERTDLLAEITSLQSGIDHIKSVITTQQSYARSSTLMQPAHPAEIFEEALRISQAARDRHAITVERQFQDIGPLMLDKHKVLQILVNLLSNAERAVKDNRIDRNPRRISLTLSLVPIDDVAQRLRIGVRDTGIGISPENLAKLFRHGFTTRSDGHGFGLHTSANAAREMGGSLSASSPGVGLGAEFILELPAQPVGVTT